MSDPFVRSSQEWLNATYELVAGVPYVDEDGEVGWQTMHALTRALQHELGITSLSDSFGPTTLALLTSLHGPITSATTNDNIVAIMQCGMWCKGYWGGTPFGDFSQATDLPTMAADMGLPFAFSLPPKAFKSLLTVDAYVLRSGGTSAAQGVQRWLNGQYISRSDYFVMPCDGLYSRDVQTGLMYAIQYELGLADGVANGELGPTTRSLLAANGNFGVGAVDSATNLVRLFQGALVFNRYSPSFSGTFDSPTVTETSAFQTFSVLSATGAANFSTWAALLVSTGDTSRSALAADTSTPLTASKAAALYSAGYRTVGRYLSVLSKRIAPGELDTIFDAGLTMFPIFQEANDDTEEFDGLGSYQGIAATKRMRQLGLKAGAPIFFAVDFDPTDEEIDAFIIPFFQDAKAAVDSSITVPYSMGVYGTRNVCSRLVSAGLVSHTFVAGMSWAWSGNLGFPLPASWSYDQFAGDDVGSGGSYLEIDKVAKSSSAPAVSSTDVNPSPLLAVGGSPAFDESGTWQWAALGYLMDLGSPASLPAGFLKNAILMALQKPDFWYDPEDPEHSGAVSQAWTAAYTPPLWTTVGFPSGLGIDLALASARFEELVRSPGWEVPVAGPIGDLPHFAASFRGLLQWGTSASATISVGDCGGWALDLVRAWVRYEEQRIAAPGGVLAARTWFASNVGGPSTSEFGEDDLRADMAAMVGYFTAGVGEPLETTMSRILAEAHADAGWLATEFFANRFGGSRSTMVAAAKDAFNTAFWPLNWPISYFLSGTRRPGETTSVATPSVGTLSTELQDVAEGFADAIIAATNW